MSKLISAVKKNNKGISLVEILATIAIIAIIAAPLVNSFISAMNVNSEARIIQNGTAVAQDTAELFKAFSLESLVEEYRDEGIEVDIDEATGKYIFEDIAVTGADGEKFLVTVELNPDVYKGGASEKIQINDVDLPVFSGLFGSDCVMLYRQYAGYDDQLRDLFTGRLEDEILEKITDQSERSKIKKTTDVKVTCDYNSLSEEYNYTFDLTMTYTYDNAESVSVTRSMQKVYNASQIHSVYMICPVFDLYSSTEVGNGFFYNTDIINVYYTYTGDSAKTQDLYFYIAEQEMYNVGYDSSMRERINPRNLYVNGVNYTMYNPELSTVKVYTNIGDNDTSFISEYGLTYGEYNSGNSLYQMDISVKLEDKDKTVVTFSTTK